MLTPIMQSRLDLEKRLKSPTIVTPTAKEPTTAAMPMGMVIGVLTGPAFQMSPKEIMELVFQTAMTQRTASSGKPTSLRSLIALNPKMAVSDMVIPPIIVKITELTELPLTCLMTEAIVVPNRSA